MVTICNQTVLAQGSHAGSEDTNLHPFQPSTCGPCWKPGCGDMTLDDIRKGLVASYTHRPVEGAKCVACGQSEVPVALHVLEFYHADTSPSPSGLVPMSRSRGTTRGAAPLCKACCPPCERCQLPIATRWVKKVATALNAKHQGITVVVGNGICRHLHLLADVKALFRAVRIQ